MYFSIKPSNKIEVVATPLGFTIVSKPDFPIKIVNPTSINALFSMLKIERVDAIYLNEMVAINYSKNHQISLFQRDDLPSDENFFYFSTISKNKFIDYFNQFISEHSDEYFNLLAKYNLANKLDK